eukprot:g5091.t1
MSKTRRLAGQYGSAGLRSDGSTCNVGNKLGDRPSIKLFPKYSSGDQMKYMLFGGKTPPSSPPPISSSSKNNPPPRILSPRVSTAARNSSIRTSPEMLKQKRFTFSTEDRGPQVIGLKEVSRNSPPALNTFASASGFLSGTSSNQYSASITPAIPRRRSSPPNPELLGTKVSNFAFANRRLWDAIRDNKRRFVLQAIEDGADPSARDAKGCGYTALHYAAMYGRLRIVEYLLTEVEADVFVRNDNGELPVDCATRTDVKELIQKAMDIAKHV